MSHEILYHRVHTKPYTSQAVQQGEFPKRNQQGEFQASQEVQQEEFQVNQRVRQKELQVNQRFRQEEFLLKVLQVVAAKSGVLRNKQFRKDFWRRNLTNCAQKSIARPQDQKDYAMMSPSSPRRHTPWILNIKRMVKKILTVFMKEEQRSSPKIQVRHQHHFFTCYIYFLIFIRTTNFIFFFFFFSGWGKCVLISS